MKILGESVDGNLIIRMWFKKSFMGWIALLDGTLHGQGNKNRIKQCKEKEFGGLLPWKSWFAQIL